MVDANAPKTVESGFTVGVAPNWNVLETETSDAARVGKGMVSWSVMLAGRDEASDQRLGILISLDPARLLAQREWPMALEQEISQVRHRVTRFLQNRHKL